MSNVKVTGLSKREMNKAVKQVTSDSPHKWFCKVEEDKIILGNDYFSEGEYYEISSAEDDYVGAQLNYCESNVMGLIISGEEDCCVDYPEWCIDAFKIMVARCFKHFNYYV